MKTRAVNKYFYANYLKKAGECFATAKQAHAEGRWNASVINCIHAAISASDAVLVFFKEVRSSGESHEDVLSLLRTLDFEREEINSKARQFQRLLQIKNAAEYEEKLMTENDSETALKDAERFLEWAREKVGVR